MPKMKLVVSDTETGKSHSVELEDTKIIPLLGKRIEETIEGSLVDMPGRELLITGGTDKDGFPLRRDVHGGVKAKVILSGKPGFIPRRKGERRRRTVRGNIITEETVQVNLKLLPKSAK